MRRTVLFAAVFVTLGIPILSAAKKPQAAIIREIAKRGSTWQITLDFVEVRDCNCDGGVEVINKNGKLRKFTFDSTIKIRLLKNVSEYFSATADQLIQGREGKNFGWAFSADTPFEFRFDADQKRVVEIQQIYFP